MARNKRQHCPTIRTSGGKKRPIQYFNPNTQRYNSSALVNWNYEEETKNAPTSRNYTYTQYNPNPGHQNEVRYKCQLKQVQCAFRRPNARGQRCSRVSTQTLPFCWQHTKLVYHLRPGQTSLRDNHGNRFQFTGLFACDMKKKLGDIVFCNTEFICPYVGERLSKALEDRRVPNNHEYLVYGMASRGVKYDAGCVRGVGALCNTGTRPSDNNAAISDTAGYPSIRATKDIYNGDEIFLSYGPYSRAYSKLPAHISRTTNARGKDHSLRYVCPLKN